MTTIRRIRTESLVEREDGQIVGYLPPVACECCGKLCTVKVVCLSDGTRVGSDCATVIELVASTAAATGKPVTLSHAEFFGANKKQIKHLRACALVT